MKEHWRVLIASAAVGTIFGLIIGPWILRRSWTRSFLSLRDPLPLIGILVGVSLVVLILWPSGVDFWRRYRRTASMAHPPLLYADLITIGITFAGITLFFFRHRILAPLHISEPMRLLLSCLGLIAILWLLGSLLWSRRREVPQLGPRTSGRVTGDYVDEPITDDTQDLLGRVEFVDRLYRQIESLPFPDSFVFGLYGGWGEGKTSVLNLLRRRLEGNPSIIPVIFNPWYPAREVALVDSFYANIEQTLRHRYLLSGLRHVLRKYRSLLTLGLHSFGFRFDFPTRADPERLRSQLEGWVARTGCRLVILIDEIDRLQEGEVLAVFKLARLSARLQNTVFLLSFDEVVIRKMLKESIGADPAYLDKVVQKPVPLPPAEQKDLDFFILFSDSTRPVPHTSAVDRLLDEVGVDENARKTFDERIVSFYRTHLRSIFRTIRHAKRYINGLRATLPYIAEEVDLYDFFLLEVIRVFFPAVHQDIWKNPWFYLPRWGSEAMLGSPFGPLVDEAGKYDIIRGHIERLLEPESQKDVAKAILEEIFFVEVKNALNPRRRTGHDNVAIRYRAEKRLTHPDCFQKYFLLRLPSGELADQVVEDVIIQWNESSMTQTEGLVADTLQRYRQEGQVIQLIDKLQVFIGRLDPGRVPEFVRALYRSVPNLSRAGAYPWETEYDLVENFLLNLIEEHIPSEEIQALVEEVVREAPSSHFAVIVVESCHGRGGGRRHRTYQSVDEGVLRRIAADRLRAHFIESNRDIFADLPEDDWGYILYQWGTNWTTNGGENRPIVHGYVMDLIGGRPEYLGRLLCRFVRKGGRGKLFFQLNEFNQIYDLEEISALLDTYGNGALMTPEAEQAALLFRKEYESKRDQEQTKQADEGT